MTALVLALGSLAALIAEACLFIGALDRRDRAHARREDLLANQLCNLAGRPWQPAPTEPPPLPDDDEDVVHDPSQQFEYVPADFGSVG